MKLPISLLALVLAALAVSCAQKSTEPTTEKSNQHQDQKDTAPPLKLSNRYEKWHNRGDYSSAIETYPSRHQESKGLLTDRGISNSFSLFVGIPMPEYAKPEIGSYNVWKQDSGDTKNFNTEVIIYFRTAPGNSRQLYDLLASTWHSKFPGGSYTHRSSTLKNKVEFDPGIVMPEGSLTYQVYTDEMHEVEHSYHLVADLVSGMFRLNSYKGDRE